LPWMSSRAVGRHVGVQSGAPYISRLERVH
jgi:hypothetical protein